MFTVFETFLNGQTVFRYGSKRVRNTLKQAVSQGSPWGQVGVTRGLARGQPRVSQGSARGQPVVNGIFSYDLTILNYKFLKMVSKCKM